VPEAVLGLVRNDAPFSNGLLCLLKDVGQVVEVDVIEDVHRADRLLGVVT
jgi:hypothetical protein